MGWHKLIWAFCFVYFLTSAKSFCQQPLPTDTISIEFINSSLNEALQLLSDKTGMRFAYRINLLKNKHVKAEKIHLPLEDILNKILVNNRLCYTFQNNQIIIHSGCFPSHYIMSGNIAENSTRTPIPYVAVSIAGKPTGTIADYQGNFEINIPWTDDGFDTLVFSSMGYLRDTVIFQPDRKTALSIFMKEKVYPVEPIVVSPREYENIELGNTKDRNAGSLYLDTHGQQTALFLKNKKNKPGIITTVTYYLSKEGNVDAPFRIHIYSVDSTGFPGKDLIEDAIVVKPASGEGWYSVNIEKMQILLPEEGAYLGIEGVFPDEFEHYYGESEFIDLRRQNTQNNSRPLTYGQRLGYNRKCSKDTWHYSMSKVWFQLEKQSFGVMISAIVKYEKEHEKEKDK